MKKIGMALVLLSLGLFNVGCGGGDKKDDVKPPMVPSDTPKPDAPKPDAPKPDAPKPDAPKPDAPKPDATPPATPKPDDKGK